jgi:hypothetical protein
MILRTVKKFATKSRIYTNVFSSILYEVLWKAINLQRKHEFTRMVKYDLFVV